MLDRRTGTLLQKLNTLIKSAAFCMVEEEDLLFAGEDSDSIKGMLGFLEDRGYLQLRYAEEGEYCVRILPEGRLYFERAAAENQEETKRSRSQLLCAFLGALGGGLLGGGLIALIMALIG